MIPQLPHPRPSAAAVRAGLLLVALAAPAVEAQTPPAPAAAAPAPAVRLSEWESRALEVPASDRFLAALERMAAEPHVAGLPGSRAVAEYALEELRAYGLDARIEEFEALMPLPAERRVELVAPRAVTLSLEEPPVEGDPDASDNGHVPTFNAYSADGDVTADVVYVNYGRPEDFDRLAELGIDVKGKIVLARYGQSWRGIKPKVASERGAIGCLIYSDPRDDGYYQGPVYPEGPYRPEHGVQRGSVMDMPVHPGDPLSPGWSSVAGGRRLARAEAQTILKIPVLPISHGDALPILQALRGEVVPDEWKGALPVTYYTGPGPARVRLHVSFDWQTRRLFNVVATIPGAHAAEQWVVYGNHHDAWNNGASDPVSGAATLLETARALGTIVKAGWQPRRTIKLALWDGEEWGLLGSTEWAEHHADHLREHGVAYINSDSTGRGWLGAGGSHSLTALVNAAAASVADPLGRGTVADAALARRKQQGRDNADGNVIPLGALGSGSDYTAFLDHLTLASLNLGFGGDGGGGVYHSQYDTPAWYRRFSDGKGQFSPALARVMTLLVMRLADAPVLPFRFTHLAATVDQYAGEVEKLAGEKAPERVSLAPLRSAVARLRTTAAAADAALDALAPRDGTASSDALARLNGLLLASERRWRHEEGLPGRPWFKHLLYAPGFYTGYGVKTLPGIREGLEQGRLDEAAAFVATTAAAVQAMADHLEEVTEVAKEAGSGR
ncbi:MAG: M28 family peptidase [Vicinamibacteraceae bacterium]|nr:M28 family peptidase [Vicinamibacteraceae bacterium]